MSDENSTQYNGEEKNGAKDDEFAAHAFVDDDVKCFSKKVFWPVCFECSFFYFFFGVMACE